MAIEELLTVVSPPEHVLEAGSYTEWDAVQAALELRLPQDYFDLCRTYGSGEFASIVANNPFSRRYLSDIDELLSMYRSLQSTHGPEAIPYAIHPIVPGLLPCGYTLDGGMIFYLTAGQSDRWPLVLLGHVFEWQQLDMSITTFLAKACSGQLDCIFWNTEWRNENLTDVTFTPRAFG